MIKKISLAVLAAALSTSAFAAGNVSTEAQSSADSIQTQIDALKQEIAALQNKTAKVEAVHANEAQITVPTNQGSIQNFLFSDVRDGVTPIGMLSSSQFALGILKQRNMFSDHSLVFGGYLEADAQAWNGSKIQTTTQVDANDPSKGYEYYSTSGRNIYLTTATLYSVANMGRYVTAELDLSGDQDNTPDVQDAMVIFGNLSDYPVFVTVGKNRPSVGSFAGGGPWTGSLTQMLFRPDHITNASVNFAADGLNTSLAVFGTDDQTTDFSYGAFYGHQVGNWSYGINGGYMYDVNGSGNSSFNDATQASTGDKRIGAVNFDGSLNYDIYGVGAGWAQSTNKDNLTNNGYAGAWYISAGMSPVIYGRSTNFSISYNGAYNTDNLPVTLSGSAINGYETNDATVSGSGVDKMVIASVQRPIFSDNVLLGLEYAYMHMYNSQHTNAYTADLSVYF
ncbi:MAG: DUF3573 domain-containing protein [Francisellaceae bacterium]